MTKEENNNQNWKGEKGYMENETTFTKFGNSFQSKVIALLLTNKSFLQTISDILKSINFIFPRY